MDDIEKMNQAHKSIGGEYVIDTDASRSRGKPIRLSVQIDKELHGKVKAYRELLRTDGQQWRMAQVVSRLIELGLKAIIKGDWKS